MQIPLEVRQAAANVLRLPVSEINEDTLISVENSEEVAEKVAEAMNSAVRLGPADKEVTLARCIAAIATAPITYLL